MSLYPSSVIEFIKDKTGGLLKENNKEYQFFCPFCDDAYRKSNPRWGHLYVSKDKPVFFCQRCNEKGHIVKLLEYLQYPNIQDVKKLFKYTRNKYVIHINDDSITNTEDKINDTIVIPDYIDVITGANINRYKLKIRDLEQYLHKRTLLTLRDTKLYYMKPIYNKKLKLFGILFLARNFFQPENFIPFQIRYITNNKKFRYQKLISSSNNHSIIKFKYFLTNITNYSVFKVKNIIVTEGTFDAINLFNIYADKLTNLLVVSITGSFYQKCIINLIQYFPCIENIHLFLDQDIECLTLRRNIRYELNYNIPRRLKDKKIQLHYYKNILSKDYGEIITGIAPIKLNQEVITL